MDYTKGRNSISCRRQGAARSHARAGWRGEGDGRAATREVFIPQVYSLHTQVTCQQTHNIRGLTGPSHTTWRHKGRSLSRLSLHQGIRVVMKYTRCNEVHRKQDAVVVRADIRPARQPASQTDRAPVSWHQSVHLLTMSRWRSTHAEALNERATLSTLLCEHLDAQLSHSRHVPVPPSSSVVC